MEDHSASAQIIVAVALVLMTGLLMLPRRRRLATQRIELSVPNATPHVVQPGQLVPQALEAQVPSEASRTVRMPFLRVLIIGKDNRTSTSKTVALLWTYAVVYGLLSLLIADWLGTPAGWEALLEDGLQEEYLLLLGGPYAAAVLAKHRATTTSAESGKTDGQVGEAKLRQIVTDDTGDVDLGDFQYVLFNAVALAFFLGAFIPELQDGLPELPSLLTGLALTSATGYAAKQLIGQALPRLTAVSPASAAQGSAVEVWGRNLIIPSSVAPSGTPLTPKVTIGGKLATVTASEHVLGADHLTVQIAADAAAGAAEVTAVRADGLAAKGPDDGRGLALQVTPGS